MTTPKRTTFSCRMFGHKFRERIPSGRYDDGTPFEAYTRVSTTCMRFGCEHRQRGRRREYS